MDRMEILYPNRTPETFGPVICAAVHWITGPSLIGNVFNVSCGSVVVGRRHHHIHAQLLIIAKDHKKSELYGNTVEGFVTKNWYFVTRAQAMIIAKHFSQLIKESNSDLLYSEDLY